MIVQLEFENSSIGTLPYSNLDAFSFSTSLFKNWSMATVRIKDFAKSTFNLIKSGMVVNVVFTDEEGNKSYTNRMKILSFTKVPQPQLSITDYLELNLISALYFDKSSACTAYDGSVGTIIQNIMDKMFKDSVGSFDGTSTDDLARRRYQTYESTLPFINRIIKYGIKDNMPVYLYSDSKGVLNLKGISELMSITPEYICHPIATDTINNWGVGDSTKGELIFDNFQAVYSGKKACSEITNKFTVANFRYSSEELSEYTFTSIENSNNQVKDITPSKTVFYGWNYTPNDALAIAARDSFEKTFGTCVFAMSIKGFHMDKLDVGKTVDIYLPYTATEKSSNGSDANLSEGRYIITDINYSFQNASMITKCTLSQVTC